jgi:hypothetical protein
MSHVKHAHSNSLSGQKVAGDTIGQHAIPSASHTHTQTHAHTHTHTHTHTLTHKALLPLFVRLRLRFLLLFRNHLILVLPPRS